MEQNKDKKMLIDRFCHPSANSVEVSPLAFVPERLQKNATLVTYKKGEYILCRGEACAHAYLIVSGKVSVETEFSDGYVYKFSELQTGDMMSDIAILAGKDHHSANAIARKDSVLLRFPRTAFEYELQYNHEFLYRVASMIALRLHDSSFGRGKNIHREGIDRVVVFLIEECEKEITFKDTIRITKLREAIASETGLSVRSVNRAIQKLRQMDCVGIKRGKLTVNRKQFAALQKLVCL